MRISRGAERLLSFLWDSRRRDTGESWWSQARMAEVLRCCVRTIGRWVSELVKLGCISVRRRGSTSAVYRLTEAAEKLLKTTLSRAQNVRSDRTKCPIVASLVIITEPEHENQKQAGPACVVENSVLRTLERPAPAGVSDIPRKPAVREERTHWTELIPPRTKVNEFGRVVANPAFYCVRDALERAEDRIRRARNPDAYARAIVLAELEKSA